MESCQSLDEPDVKRPKIKSEGSTSAKPKAKDPFLSLPSDILVKIISNIPLAQWPSLELLDNKFQAATLIAWRQLRSVNLERQFWLSTKHENATDRSWVDDIFASVLSILHKLAECSPYLTSLNLTTQLCPDIVHLLAQFEHLQSITLGKTKSANDECCILLESVVEFLELTRSRASLKELRIFGIDHYQSHRATMLDRFALSFVSGRDIQLPLQMEKFSFSSLSRSLNFRLDTLDTTRLIELRVGKASIEPDHLTSLIERASELRRIELSFLTCISRYCNGPRLRANKNLLTALGTHKNLTAIHFDRYDLERFCTCGHFVPEFVEMLKAIGRRGKLRKLALENRFDCSSGIDSNQIFETIREYLPYLQSIKINLFDLTEENMVNIASLPELEEVRLSNMGTPVTANVIKRVTQLPHLKCLALDKFQKEDDQNSLEYLAYVKTLMDLRIRFAELISNETFEKWSEGFASNLQILMLDGISMQNIDNEKGLIRLLEEAVRLRVLILEGRITDQSLMAIAKSCPQLEIFGVGSISNEITTQGFQEIVDACPKLKCLDRFCMLGRVNVDVRDQSLFPKYRKIVSVYSGCWNYDYDDDEYD